MVPPHAIEIKTPNFNLELPLGNASPLPLPPEPSVPGNKVTVEYVTVDGAWRAGVVFAGLRHSVFRLFSNNWIFPGGQGLQSMSSVVEPDGCTQYSPTLQVCHSLQVHELGLVEKNMGLSGLKSSQLVHKTSLSAVAFKTIANPFGQFSVKPQIVLSATPSSVPESPLPEISSEIILY